VPGPRDGDFDASDQLYAELARRIERLLQSAQLVVVGEREYAHAAHRCTSDESSRREDAVGTRGMAVEVVV
jgi:hypothetical protein